jgi:hypothetical protein
MLFGSAWNSALPHDMGSRRDKKTDEESLASHDKNIDSGIIFTPSRHFKEIEAIDLAGGGTAVRRAPVSRQATDHPRRHGSQGAFNCINCPGARP